MSTYQKYLDFLESKKHSKIKSGIKPVYDNPFLFDYQKHVTKYLVEKGRAACFLDTGLGKTLIELSVAQNYVEHTNKPVLIITPLAVAFQFIKEAQKFNIDNVEYSKDGTFKSTTKIVICNYERLHKFDSKVFDCVILDESSILKNFNGAIKSLVTGFMKKVKYRFLFTATPSPNDFIELGTSSEALGYLGYMDMLGKFFKNNQNDTGGRQNIGNKFYLKPHAKNDFFEWVGSWSISMRKPSDLGFSDDNYKLPNLIQNDILVKNDKELCVNGQYQMFNIVAKTRSEIAAENRATINSRCEKAVELSSNYDTSVYWCNFNNEGDLLESLDKDAIQLKGSLPLSKKEDIIKEFSDGNIKKLITKPKISSFGLNWQHCNHTVYFPTFSYEQYYQAIRRFYRFGQKKDVVVDRVYSDGQVRVLQAINEKSKKAAELFKELNETVNGDYKTGIKENSYKIELPKFL